MMEAAEVLKTSPSFDFDYNNPARFLKGTNYLNPLDPIDGMLLEYKEEIDSDTFPTAAVQRNLITGIRSGDLQSARELIDTHMGLIAAVAYPFAHCGIDAEDLLTEGKHALINAAKTFELEEPGDFSDYAAFTINSVFSEALPEVAGDTFVKAQRRPMEGIYSFVETLEQADSIPKMQKVKSQNKNRSNRELNQDEFTILQMLHLPEKDISDITGMRLRAVGESTAEIKRKLSAQTREEAALVALDNGIDFDVLEIPDIKEFTVRERQVAMLLGQRNPAIQEQLGLSKAQVSKAVKSLLSKTQARSRAELAVMARMNEFEPMEEELNPPPLALHEKLSPKQRDAARLILGMSDEDAAKKLKTSEGNVSNLITRSLAKAEVSNRVELILALHRSGMKFDLVMPEEPIAETLYSHEIEIAKILHLPNEEIIKILQLGCTDKVFSSMLYRIKTKVGARSRQELALMVEMFYDGSDALVVDPNSNEWRLWQGLGLNALNGYDLDELLEETTGPQKKFITAFYRAARRVTWEEVGESFGVNGVSAAQTAYRGITRMRRRLYSEVDLA